MATSLYSAMLAGVLVYTVVWWRIFNKAHRSGILLIWGLVCAAAWPWIADPDEWLVVGAVGVSFLVSLGVASTMVSIIGRPLWWVMPVVLAYLPWLATLLWEAQARAFQDMPEAMEWATIASWGIAVAMVVPLYLMGMHDLGDAFGYGTGFQLGLMLLPFVFLPIVAFDSNHYGDWGMAKRRRTASRSPVPGHADAAPAPPPRTTFLPPLNGGATPTPRNPGSGRPDAGWYTNPDGSGGLRWWDGGGWTAQVDTEGHATAPEPQWDRH